MFRFRLSYRSLRVLIRLKNSKKGRRAKLLLLFFDKQKGRVLPLPALPPTVLQNTAKKPETKIADKPQAKAQPIPGPNTQAGQELTVRPKAAPQTVKPEAKVDELPQPVTPDAPRNNQPPQSPPPRGVDPRVVPPIIITAGALGKLTLDKLSNEQKAELQAAGHTLPSMPPDSARIAGGKSTPINPKQDAQTTRSYQRENESAQILAKAGFKVEQNPSITAQDRIDNAWLSDRANPDYKIEGKIFDCLSPSSNRAFNFRDKIVEKVNGGQTRRIVLNIEDSAVSQEELKQVLLDNPIKDLEEVLVIKGGHITYFYPFK